MIYIAILFGVLFGDLAIKRHVEQKVEMGEEYPILDGRFVIRKLHNDGLAFGRLSDHPKLIKWGNLGMLGSIILYFIWLLAHPGQRLKKAGLGMMIGGGLSNEIDRIQKGYVTDYVSIQSRFAKIKRIVFNISDFFIFAGSILYILGSYRKNTGK
jgi:signal peptidase II